MTPQRLKNSILQMAIQGKLVEQRKEEGTGEELFRQIQAEKQKLIKAGKLKKEKPLPKIAEEEIPFDIPENWCWCLLKDIADVFYGFPLDSSKFNCDKNGKMIVRIRDIKPAISNTYTTEEIPQEYHLHKNDMLVGMDGIFNVNFWSIEGALLNQRVCKITTKPKFYEQKLLFYILPIFLNEISKNVSFCTVKHLSDKHLSTMYLPLPPLAEQKRIVAKIEELLPLIDRYEQAWTKLEDFNKRFPDDMQKSILQMAIQGKLVEQRKEEGTGEELFRQIQAEKQRLIKAGKIKREKPLSPITEEEMPFEIPESWKWCYVGDIFQHNTGKALNGSDKSGTPMKYITTSNLYWNRFVLDKLKEMPFTETEIEKCTIQKGDLLVCEGGDYGRSAIWPYDFPMRIQNHIHRLRAYGLISVLYFYYIFYFYKNSGMISGRGIGIQGLSSNALHTLKIPLPPIAEQKRIVAKLEELLPLCDKLKASKC